MTFFHRGLECRSRKSRDTWSNRQVWPWSKKWSRAKPNRVLPRERTGHSKHPPPTTQETTLHMTAPDGQYWNQIDYFLCSQRWGSCIQSAKKGQGADCGSDHKLTAKFRLKLKKVGKTTGAYEVAQMVKNLLANAGDEGDLGLILGLGRFPGGGHGNPL